MLVSPVVGVKRDPRSFRLLFGTLAGVPRTGAAFLAARRWLSSLFSVLFRGLVQRRSPEPRSVEVLGATRRGGLPITVVGACQLFFRVAVLFRARLVDSDENRPGAGMHARSHASTGPRGRRPLRFSGADRRPVRREGPITSTHPQCVQRDRRGLVHWVAFVVSRAQIGQVRPTPGTLVTTRACDRASVEWEDPRRGAVCEPEVVEV